MANLNVLIDEYLSREMQSLLYLLGSWGERSSHKVFAAGEFIFELLRGKETKKVNLVVIDSAVEFAQSLTKLLPGKLETQEKMGTATLRLQGNYHVEFDMVTAQKDILYAFSEKTDLIENALKNELYKHDFTVFTMACALNSGSFGKLFDFFGGYRDFQEGIIKTLYNLSFVDNPCRILRAVRVEQNTGFKIEEETFSFLKSAVKKRLLERISREQINAEIRAILKGPSPAGIFTRLQELKIFKRMFPRVNYTPELNKRLLGIEDILKKQAEGSLVTGYNAFILYISALFFDLPEHDIKYLSYLLRLKKREYSALCSTIENASLILHEAEKDYWNWEKIPTESMILAYVLADDRNMLGDYVVNYVDSLLK